MSGSDLLVEYLTKFFPILVFTALALGFGLVTLVLSYLVQPKYPEAEKTLTNQKVDEVVGGYLIRPIFWGWKSLDCILGVFLKMRSAGGELSLRPQSKNSMS